MLTRKDYEKALNGLRELEKEDNSKKLSIKNVPQLKADTLNELIEEHFDNPPLTLDELYEFVKQDTDYHYLPVWDNKFGGQWFVLENINGNKLKFKGYDHPIEFEEGRYYRKEVQECN
ncbi:hypothetical protein ACTQX5_02635 [Faecalicoccus sp. LCP19S3_E3]|uniref:hypothetical protein n=1 Tax=unclassified Faecalicoccus TaxID=2643311 RepID=UPI003F8E7AD9